MNPFFSIITATYNAAGSFTRLLDSLAMQTCRDFELVVQDGASQDDTLSIAGKYREAFAVSMASAPDSGIYDAWNSAIARAKGEWVLFLGADDALAAPDTLEKCLAILRELPPSALYAGGAVLLVAAGGETVAHPTYDPEAARKLVRREMPFPHQGVLHRKSLFSGRCFDKSLTIAGDYDFVCRTWSFSNGNTVLPVHIARMQRGGISDQPQHVLRLRWENAVIAARYFPDTWTAFCLLGLAKGCLIRGLYTVLGSRVPILLDTVRRLRGLPPAWKGL